MASPTAADKKKREQERIKKQLMVLGVLMVLVVFANRHRFMGKSGAKTGPQRATAAASANVPASGAAPVPGAPAPTDSSAPTGPAQTPYDIPTLTPEVIEKLRARASKRPLAEEGIDPKQFARTVNPFTTFDVDVEQLAEQEARDKGAIPVPTQKVSGTTVRRGPTVVEVPPALKAYHSFGVMILDGEKQAIIKKDGRVVPYHLREGERFEAPDDNFQVIIRGDNRVVVEDANAPGQQFELGTSAPKPVAAEASIEPLKATTGTTAGAADRVQFILDEEF